MAESFFEWRMTKMIAQIIIELSARIKTDDGSSYRKKNETICKTVATIMTILGTDELVTFIRENTPTEAGLVAERLVHHWDWCINFTVISSRPELRGTETRERDFFIRESSKILPILDELVLSLTILGCELSKIGVKSKTLP